MESEYSQMMKTVDQLLDEILAHGFGEARIRISTQQERKRHVVIEAGKSHHFVIQPSDTKK